MPIFIIECRLDSYATTEVEADTLEEAIVKAKHDPDGKYEWDLDTDWDSSTDFKEGIRYRS